MPTSHSDTTHPTPIPAATPSQIAERLQWLETKFPEAFTDGVLDLNQLQYLNSSTESSASERYGLSWAGKRDAQAALAHTTTATLHPDLTESVGFDDASNVFIEGDNLEVLRLLQRGYNDAFKLIYIDPPYNTGHDFVYRDNFTDGLNAYLNYTGQTNADGTRKSSKTDTNGRRHSGWLSMMYPRLALARNLLREDGAIFVSIDDNEVHNLRLLLDEVYGPENFIGQFIWAAGRKNDSKFVSQSHEYIVVYARNKTVLTEQVGKWRTRKDGLDPIYKKYEELKRAHGDDYDAVTAGLKGWYRALPDGDPSKRHSLYSHADARGVFRVDNLSWPGGGGPRYAVLHPTTGHPVRVPHGGWRFQHSTMVELLEQARVHFGADERAVPAIKGYLQEREHEAPYSVFYQSGIGATKRLRSLLDGDFFDNPKDETVLQRIVEFATGPDDLVLDFFAGSGSTGHAVMAQNAKDGGNRRFVLVTLDEPTVEGSKAHQSGVATIPEITRRRLMLAARQVHGEGNEPGLRCYRLGASNFRSWDSRDVPTDEESLISLLEVWALHEDPDAAPESLVAEVVVKEGLRLDVPWQWTEFAEGQGVLVGDTVVCLHSSVTPEVVDAVLALGVKRCVMLESAFADHDQDKSNAFYRLREGSVTLRTM